MKTHNMMLANNLPQNSVPETIAAVDLGSNSFHMIVAKIENGQIKVIDKMREMVRMGAGLNKQKHLNPDVAERALACLERFGQRLRSLTPGSVVAVGTNTMRQIQDSGQFIEGAQHALGHPIEIIAGREEARLVYLGVAHGLATDDQQRLVVDIGGGSTELIIGQGYSPLERESMHMGCVSQSQGWFADGVITQQAMSSAIMAGRVELRPVGSMFSSSQWQQAVGSSGTIRAIRNVVVAAGWCEDGITKDALQKLQETLIAIGKVDKIKLEGVSKDRRPVFAGGVAVLSAVFLALKIDKMHVSDMALREGLLYEMLGQINHVEDVRERSVETLTKRYSVDLEQANRVEMTATSLLAQVAKNWGMLDQDYAVMLSWASRLHEIGIAVSHSQFHKHGAYIIAHSDLPGFSQSQQQILATMVRIHRRKFALSVFEQLPKAICPKVQKLCLLLRLAVLLHRGRSNTNKPMVLVEADEHSLQVCFPEGWLAKSPLIQAELERETKRIKTAGFKLTCV